MSDVVLEFDRVWKKFRKGELHDSLRDLIPTLAQALFSRNHRNELQMEEFWALRDISFQVRRGEALGIIGPNGAGKSTILKLLSRILRPNQGKINVRGRMSALIEVGAGFHLDLTGRENVYLNATILGMKKAEIDRKFDEIVAFAGLEDFIDTPVKRYSTGMFARLGFSVAAHVEPDILLVDEVLSVGDMQFQERCLEKMLSLPTQGTTVVFVSHNLAAVQALCPKAALIMHGRLESLGNTRDVTLQYVRAVQGGEQHIDSQSCIRRVRLENEAGAPVNTFEAGQHARLRFSVEAPVPLSECILVFIVRRVSDGLTPCDYNLQLKEMLPARAASGKVDLTLHFDVNLLRGAYTILLRLYHCSTLAFLVREVNAGLFSVDEMTSREGTTHLNPKVVEEVDADSLQIDHQSYVG